MFNNGHTAANIFTNSLNTIFGVGGFFHFEDFQKTSRRRCRLFTWAAGANLIIPSLYATIFSSGLSIMIIVQFAAVSDVILAVEAFSALGVTVGFTGPAFGSYQDGTGSAVFELVKVGG